MKVRMTYRVDRFEITFEWNAAHEESEQQFDITCLKMMRKLQKLGAVVE